MNKDAIENHKIAAGKLILIKDKTFGYIKKNIGKISEYDVNKFVLTEFRKENLVTDKNYPTQIVAVNQSAANPHYYPPRKKSAILMKDNLILLDIWARLKKDNSPFADIAWIAYSGENMPSRIERIFKIVITARNNALGFIKNELNQKRFPKTNEIDKAVRSYFKKFGLEKFFIHKTGHSLGLSHCHGRHFSFSKKSESNRLKPNIPFTIEPGLYFKNEFGIRSEIDCYVTEDYKLIATTEIQKKIIKI